MNASTITRVYKTLNRFECKNTFTFDVEHLEMMMPMIVRPSLVQTSVLMVEVNWHTKVILSSRC